MTIPLNTSILNVSERTIGQVNADVADTARQVHSGVAPQRYNDMADDAKRYLSIESTQDKITKTTEELNRFDGLLSRQEYSLNLIFEQLRGVQAGLLNAMDAAVGDSGLQTFRSTVVFALDQIESALNAQDSEGRYVFGNDVMESVSVDFTRIKSGAADGVINSGVAFSESALLSEYYTGGDNPVVYQRDSGTGTLTTPIAADGQGIIKSIRGLRLAIMGIDALDRDMAREAHGYIVEGYDQMADEMLVPLGSTRKSVSENLDILAQESEEVTDDLSDIINADFGVKATELVQKQIRLQALLGTTQISNQILKDFIANYRG